jgi:CheY-like chemotaxis protein
MSGRAKPKVLVVDDEKVITTTLAAILEQQGYAVRTAFDGAEAVEVARSFKPDVLLSDIVMPRMNGVAAAVKIAQQLPSCKILLFSGQTAQIDLLAPARAEGYGFSLLAKPVHPVELLERINGLVAVVQQPLILNVDDNEAMRYAMTRLLENAGLRVVEATTGEEAIRVAASKKPYLVILDLKLPDIDGFEVCKQLKANPDTRGIHIVHLTNTFKNEAARAMSVQVGADDYLTHPIEPDTLFAHLSRLLPASGR